MKYLFIILAVLLAGCVESQRTMLTREPNIRYDGHDIILHRNKEYMLRRVVGGYQHDYDILTGLGYTYTDGDDGRYWVTH